MSLPDSPPIELTLGEIGARLGATVLGDETIRIRRVSGIREAEPGDLTFIANPKYRMYLEETRASAILVPPGMATERTACLEVLDPYAAFLTAIRIFGREPDRPEPGIHPTAVVSPRARIGEGARIGANVIVSDDVEIGANTVIMGGCYLGHRSQIGTDCFLYPNCILREDTILGDRVILHPGVVLGSDGFGYAFDGRQHVKIPQIGRVVLEDDVEIGANSAIDRATTGETRVRRGTKIDNLVHLAHNVDIGEHSILCAQVGISGSATLGHHVVLGGQVGTVGHIEIGAGTRVGAQSGVTKSIAPGKVVSGYPATNHSRAQRVYAAMRSLPEALKGLRRLEQRVQQLEAQSAEGRDTSSPGGAIHRNGEKSKSNASHTGAASREAEKPGESE